MSTYAMSYRRGPSLWPWLILAAIGIMALTLPPVIERVHAALHDEAEQIRACYDAGNLLARMTRINLKSNLQRDNCLVELPDGRVGNRVVQFCKNIGWLEITAYVIGDGELKTAIDTLKAEGCEQTYP